MGSREEKPFEEWDTTPGYKLGGAGVTLAGFGVFAFSLAYLPGWWRLLAVVGFVMGAIGLGVLFYGLLYHRTDA